MQINGLVGDWHAWLMLAGAWLGLGALMALALGLIARVGAGRGKQKGN